MAVDRDVEESFDDYVRARSVALQRFAYLVVGNADDARDCVQDALLGLLPRWDAVRSGGDVDAYVRRSIVNASVSRWRKGGCRTVPVAEPDLLPGAVTPDHAGAVADAALAWQLCDTLPPAQRAAVVLRFWQDLSFAEIGRTLGCTEATARSHVHRALTRLRTRLVAGGDHD